MSDDRMEITTLAQLLALPSRTILELRLEEVARLTDNVGADHRGAYLTNFEGERSIDTDSLPATVLKLGEGSDVARARRTARPRG